jgi:hypothetical protein
MSKQYMPIEKVVALFGNRYVALNLASQEVRRIIEGLNRGEVQLPGSPYYQGLRRLIEKEVAYEEVVREPVTEPLAPA